jgi:hypothetical protein
MLSEARGTRGMKAVRRAKSDKCKCKRLYDSESHTFEYIPDSIAYCGTC